MKTRCTQLLIGVALSAWCTYASAAVKILYEENFNGKTLAQVQGPWDFLGTLGTPKVMSTNPTNPVGAKHLDPTDFLGEFGGNDHIKLTVNVPKGVTTVQLKFDAYLLRTWDGIDSTPIPHTGNEPTTLGGPDRFNFGYNGNLTLPADGDIFSNGSGPQSFCPGKPAHATCEATFSSDPDQKNRLGFEADLPPLAAQHIPYSLVYHFDTGPISYHQSQIMFDFLSSGLQTHQFDLPNTPVIDESWGLDNIIVTGVPEPRTWMLLAAGLVLSSLVATRRRRVLR